MRERGGRRGKGTDGKGEKMESRITYIVNVVI